MANPVVVGMPDGQSVGLLEELPPLPPPPAAAALDCCAEDEDVDPPAVCCADCDDGDTLLAAAGELSVWVGTLSGSVPHDEDVVTPPVELSDTEHGMPLRLRAGLP